MSEWAGVKYWIKNDGKPSIIGVNDETYIYSLWEVIREVFDRFCKPSKKDPTGRIIPNSLNTFHCDPSLWYQSRMCVNSWTYLTDQKPHTKEDFEFHVPTSAFVSCVDGTRDPTSIANFRAKINQCKAKMKTLHVLTCDEAEELAVLAVHLTPKNSTCPYNERYTGLFQRIFKKVEIFTSYWGDKFFICEHPYAYTYRDDMLSHVTEILTKKIVPALEPLQEPLVIENAPREHENFNEAFDVWLSLHAY